MGTTTVELKTQTWKRLNGLKEPGESFDDVVTELLDDRENVEGAEQ